MSQMTIVEYLKYRKIISLRSDYYYYSIKIQSILNNLIKKEKKKNRYLCTPRLD